MKKNEHMLLMDKIQPYPFYYNASKKVFIKIIKIPEIDYGDIKGNENKNPDKIDELIEISLINKNMLDYDNLVLGNDVSEYIYRPYFYEFYIKLTSITDDKLLTLLIKNQGIWLEGRFENKYIPNNEDTFTVLGDIFFSASPFQIERTYLTITDTKVPPEINQKLLSTYDVSSAIVSPGTPRERKMNSILDNITFSKDFNTRFYNVGQGNCVYIKTSTRKRILFDIGYSKIGSLDWSDPKIIKSKHAISHMRPHLNILSHWDLDHILGIAFAQDSMFTHPWVAPNLNELTKTTASAARLAKYLCAKNQLYLIDKAFLNSLVYTSPYHNFNIYRGKGIGNTGKPNYGLNQANNYGLIIELNGMKRMLLPGDCEYTMFPQTLYFSSKVYDYLMVPHHCSRMPLVSFMASSLRYAFVSAGFNTYRPKHPYIDHIEALEKENHCVLLTKENKYIEVRSLNRNLAPFVRK